MRILMTNAGYERIRGRLAAVAPDAEIITVTGPHAFARGGQPLAADAVHPEVVWYSLDSYAAGLSETVADRLLKAEAPRWTQLAAAGIDSPIFRQIMARGIRVSKSSAQSVPIAEYVVAHALSLQAPIEAQAALQREHRWEFTPYREICGSRWVLIGYGSIGRQIARRIKPFGVDLTVVRRSPEADEWVDHTVGPEALGQVLHDADVVVLAAALNDSTRGLADAAFFRALKPGAILINIGRGALIDEAALREGLERDQPGRAVLDVFATEPLPADSWFWDHPKVRVSAHTSHTGDGVLERGAELFLNNLRRYLAGEPLLHEASPSEVGL